jgi:hypothetical protein
MVSIHLYYSLHNRKAVSGFSKYCEQSPFKRGWPPHRSKFRFWLKKNATLHMGLYFLLIR